MSDDKQPPKPPAPMKRTSAVPIKKETVRVSLKADPQTPRSPAPPPPMTTSAAPPASTTAPAPPTVPVTSSAAPPAPAPAPTVPLKTAPAATPAVTPAPTIALRAPGAPAAAPVPTGGPATVPLTTTAPPATAPASTDSQATQNLPQATVNLQSTQQLGVPTAPTVGGTGASFGTMAVEEEEEASDIVPTVASILAFVLGLAALALSLLTWTAKYEVGDLF